MQTKHQVLTVKDDEGIRAPVTPRKRPIELREETPKLDETAADVRALVQNLERTEVLDGKSQWAQELRGSADLDSPEGGLTLPEEIMATLNNAFEHECLEEAVVLLGATPRPDNVADTIRGQKYTLKYFPNVTFLSHQVWAIWFIVRRWIFDYDLPGALVADEMGLGKTFTVLAAALYAKSLTEELLTEPESRLSVLHNRTLAEWRQEEELDFERIPDIQRTWYPCSHRFPVPRRLLQLAATSIESEEDPSHIAPWHPVLCVVLPSVRETFVRALEGITQGTSFAIRDLGKDQGPDITQVQLNFSREYPKRRWDIHVVTYNMFTERAQKNPSGSVPQLTQGVWSWGIFDESQRYKGSNSIGFKVARDAMIGFKIQATATPAYHSLRDWGSTTCWLFRMPLDVQDTDVVNNHGAQAMVNAVRELELSVKRGDPVEDQKTAATNMITVARPWTIRRWAESRLASGAPLANIPQEMTHQVPLQWSTEEQAQLKKVVLRLQSAALSESHGVAWRVHRWQLACFSFVLEDDGDRHANGEWRKLGGSLENFVEGPIFRWLREFLPALMQARARIPRMTPNDEELESDLPQKAVMFCPLPGQVRHVAWWLRLAYPEVETKTMFSEDSAERRTELMSEFQNSPCCTVFITTTKIGGTGLNLVAANHAVVLQKPWVLNEQRQAFGRIVRLGQMREPHCWLLNTGPGGYDDRVTELHTTRGTAQLLVLHGLMDQPEISIEDLYNVLQSRKEETERASRRLGYGATETLEVCSTIHI